MGHAGRTRFPRTSGAGRRRVSWSGGPDGNTGSISSSTVFLFGGIATASADDLTIIRTRGELLLYLTSVDAVGAGYSWRFGICNVTQNAAGIGVTAVPDPNVDVGWDGWLYHAGGELRSMGSTDASLIGANTAMVRHVIDSKAMRKTHASDAIIAVLSVTETVTAVMRGHLTTRILDKLA